MGEVFLARASGAAGFQKFVVIKKILPHLLKEPRFIDGLVREAKLLVNLQHPNIVQVVDLGIEGEDYFMAMEYVHGYNMATITHFCATTQTVIPEAACVYMVTQVLAALQYAHERTGPRGERQNIIHRDVSPQNVLIADDGQVRLTDFGIAKVLSDADQGYTNSLKGKYRYMAPEAVDGGLVDQRYDLFAAGILLYESLCRRHLFAARRNEDILAQIRSAKVPDVEQYHPGITPQLVSVLRRSLEKDPEARYQTAREFADALRAALHPCTEAQAGLSLRTFIEALYGKDDFPINKPKLWDLHQAQSAKTQTVITSGRVLREELEVPPETKQKRIDIWLWLGALILVGLGVGVLSYALWDQGGTQAKPVGSDGGSVGEARSRFLDSALVDGNSRTLDAVTRPTVVGPFQIAEAARLFSQNSGALRTCFNRHLKSGERIDLKAVSTVDAQGRVIRSHLEAKSAIPEGLRKCLVAVVGGLRYQAHDKPSVQFAIPLKAQVLP